MIHCFIIYIYDQEVFSDFIIGIATPLVLVYKIHPDESMSIGLIMFLPLLFILNLLLALLALVFYRFILKRKDTGYPVALVLNSVTSPIIFYSFFCYAMGHYIAVDTDAQRYRIFSFSVAQKKYKLSFDVNEGDIKDNGGFTIYEQTISGGQPEVIEGVYSRIKDTVLLVRDTTSHEHLPVLINEPFKMKIVNQKLTGFPLHPAEITLDK